MVLAVVDDLLFSSKLRAAASAATHPIVFVRKRAEVMAAMREHRPSLVIIDLDRDALDPVGAIGEIRAASEFAAAKIVGFGSHVNTERLQAARAAGCDRPMARSAFVMALPDLMKTSDAQDSSKGTPQV